MLQPRPRVFVVSIPSYIEERSIVLPQREVDNIPNTSICCSHTSSRNQAMPKISVVADNELLRHRDESLADLLARANFLLSESFYEQLKNHGLSATEWRVLAALSEHDGVKMTELAELVLF